MKWSNVKLIFVREVRDQLRDRRTLFTIAVLPLLLYPLLGMSFLQVAQFMKQHPTRVLLIGAENLPAAPPLLENNRFATQYLPESEDGLLEVVLLREPPPADEPLPAYALRQIRDEGYDAVVYIPPNFAERLAAFEKQLIPPSGPDAEQPASQSPAIPQPMIFKNSADDKSRMGADRIEGVLARWRESLVEKNLERRQIPAGATKPFKLVDTDVAEETSRRAAVWSKILPFVVLIWALTGAFYPAIDLCAGEKERGTLETLLSSPAQRGEIVWGKLLTIMSFSMATSLLNLASMGITGALIIRQLSNMGPVGEHLRIGPPPLAAAGWLVLALIPISALFSALSLAIAAFARSSKEGQYYLMPLLLITLPLMMLPLLPAAELDLGTSLIPVTGMMLLLRTLIEGQYTDALRFALPVVGVTAACCLLAIRWAVDQFNNESVLFRESERFDLGLWFRHLIRDRGATPTFGEALMCGVVLLIAHFLASLHAPPPQSWRDIVVIQLIIPLALIATPALLMTIMLTRSPRKTLLLQVPRLLTLPAAIALALCLNPSVHLLSEAINFVYPMSAETSEAIKPYVTMMVEQPLWAVLCVFALLPAICEELAFRGFILSGLRHMGHKWFAIILSSVFFGATHGLLQQSLSACVVGVVIGYLAVHTGSLLPCILFHFTNNALGILFGRVTPKMLVDHPLLQLIYRPAEQEPIAYQLPLAIVGAAIAVVILLWIRRLPYDTYAEEKLQKALENQSARTDDSSAGTR